MRDGVYEIYHEKKEAYWRVGVSEGSRFERIRLVQP